MEKSQKILTERKSQTFHKRTDVHSVVNATDGIGASMIFPVAAFFVGR